MYVVQVHRTAAIMRPPRSEEQPVTNASSTSTTARRTFKKPPPRQRASCSRARQGSGQNPPTGAAARNLRIGRLPS
jgi:hypothetical protein